MFYRSCPKCSKQISHKNERWCRDADKRQKLCRVCAAIDHQKTYTPQKRAIAKLKFQQTLSEWSDEYRDDLIARLRASNLKTYETLPEAYIKATLENPEWHRKISETPKNYRDPQARIRKIVETKVGMPYNDWLAVQARYDLYWMKVRTITERQPIETLVNFEKRSFLGYHLDHKFSVAEGFRNDVNPEMIGHIVNLEFIPAQQNLQKRDKCSWSLDDLTTAYDLQILTPTQALALDVKWNKNAEEKLRKYVR